ncbi:MAG: hypothetical protein M0001_09675 [Treponema sp.]|nr:hypothetical protein [Treponema sp.]
MRGGTLDASGRVLELRRAPGNALASAKTTFTVQYSNNGCTFGFKDLLGSPQDVAIRWNSEQEGMYSIKIHSQLTVDEKTGEKNIRDARIGLTYGAREAYWGIEDPQDTAMFRWRFSREVQQSGLHRDDRMLTSFEVLDNKGYYMPDTQVIKSEYKRMGKDILGYSYYRYNWIGTSDAEGWMRDDVWKFTDVRGQRPASPDVFTSVINYLILDEYFHLGTMQYFGHALFGIALK